MTIMGSTLIFNPDFSKYNSFSRFIRTHGSCDEPIQFTSKYSPVSFFPKHTVWWPWNLIAMWTRNICLHFQFTLSAFIYFLNDLIEQKIILFSIHVNVYSYFSSYFHLQETLFRMPLGLRKFDSFLLYMKVLLVILEGTRLVKCKKYTVVSVQINPEKSLFLCDIYPDTVHNW